MTDEPNDRAGEVLLPCPFCGGEASFYTVSGSYGYYSSKTGVQCGNGDCPIQPKIAFADEAYDSKKRKHITTPSKKQAITAWNNRADPLAAQALAAGHASVAEWVAAKDAEIARLQTRLEQAGTWLYAGAKRTKDEGLISAAKIIRAALAGEA